MRRAITVLAVVVLLAGPTALAFRTGGYLDSQRLIAGIVAWVLFAGAALLTPTPLPQAKAGRAALAGLVMLTLWTGASIAWAPMSAIATDALQRLLLYAGGLAAAIALFRHPSARRAAEPALALGTLVVIGYALSERLLPGILDFSESGFAFGRLEQPITYWNATGALAAMGVVLCVRIGGDASRPAWMRPTAAAAAVPLAVGVWLSYSRGALAAVGVGLLVLGALSLTRAQLRSIAIVLATGIPAAFVSDRLDGVRALEGTTRERDGLIMLAVLLVLGGLAAAATWVAARRDAGRIGLSRSATVAIAAGVVIASAAGLAFVARDAGHSAASGANAERLKSLESNRYRYWKVALEDGFAEDPLKGTGAGGFNVIWLQHRDVNERARVAHSLYVETLAELGIVGFAFLLLFLGGVVAAARRVARASPGPIAALLVFAAHCAIDWDWQVPAVALVALALAGLVIAESEAAERLDGAVA